jgi:biopolymer transport protein TolR
VGISSGGKNGFISEINVTPFVDVMLVLLIIFMITAPMMTQGLDVDLPQTKTVKSLSKASDNLVLTIKKDGALYLDEYPVALGQLKDQLNRLVKEQKKMLFLRADKEVPYGVVVNVMGEIKSAEIDKLGIVAEPTDVPGHKDEAPQSGQQPGKKDNRKS